TTAEIVAAPVLPVITVPAMLTSGASYTASVPAQANSTYAWTVTGGTITAGTATNSITFTAGASGSVSFSCVVTNQAGTASTPGTATSAIVAAPTTPVVTAPSFVTASQGGYTASVPTQANSTYAWTVTGGTITAGAATNSITFTAGASGSVSFSCVVTNQAGTASTAGTASSTIVAAPTTPVVTAPSFVTASQGGYTASVPAQASSTYAWTVTNGTITAGATSNSLTFTAGASGNVSFSCVVTNQAGTASTAGTATSAIVAAPNATISAPTYVSAGQSYTASVPAQTNSTYAWTLTNATITAGANARTVTFTAGSSGTVGFSCDVTNQASTLANGTASSTIVAMPVVTVLAATPTDVAPGGASVLSYTFSGGTGVLMPGNLAVVSGGSTTVHPSASTTYTLTVTNAAGSSFSDFVTVTVVPAPVISSFEAQPNLVTLGQGTLLTFTFTGTGVITPGNVPVTSGSQVAVFPTADTVYTLTATNSVGATVTATVPVTVKTYTGKFVYVANSGSNGISAFTLNEATGALVEIAGSPFVDTVPMLHVISDPQGRFLFAVNGDGVTPENKLSVFQINATTGVLTHLADYATGTDPWASAVDPSGQFVYVRCNGSISAFALDVSGVLTPLAAPSVTTASGTGDVVVHPAGHLLYTVGRDSDRLEVFALNPVTGALTLSGFQDMPVGTGPLSLAISHSGEYLYTKSEGALHGGAAQACFVHGYQIDVTGGSLTALPSQDMGLLQADAYHGVSSNPTKPVIYLTLATSNNDYAAYALNLATGELTALVASTYDLFGGTGSDCLTVARSGKWGFMTNFGGSQIAVGEVNATGVLINPTLYPVGLFPVSVTVVGTIQ
ncbi:MAG: beta-propeller fold lactonase family protein, partial [Firmicutes bacterium]|nr:beta-propeller fold lactonase family protein [Bacillota bacterium]